MVDENGKPNFTYAWVIAYGHFLSHLADTGAACRWAVIREDEEILVLSGNLDADL